MHKGQSVGDDLKRKKVDRNQFQLDLFVKGDVNIVIQKLLILKIRGKNTIKNMYLE